MVFRLVDKGILQRGDTLADDHSHGERVIEGGDVAEGHDARQASVALRLADVVDGCGCATGVDDQLGQLSGLICNLTDAGCSVLPHLDVDVLQAVENAREDFSLNDDFCEVDGVLGNLGEALADVSLELGIRVGDEGSQVGDGALVNDSLGKLLSVLGDLRESSCGDALKCELGLLDTEDEQTNSAGIDDRLSEVSVVLGDA